MTNTVNNRNSFAAKNKSQIGTYIYLYTYIIDVLFICEPTPWWVVAGQAELRARVR